MRGRPKSEMSEVYQRYLPPDPNGLPVAAPLQLWRRAILLAADVRLRFVALVVAPTAASALYFGLLAAPQYVSQTEYVVRGVDAHHSTGLSALLSTFGVSRAADETSAIESFLKSRDVLEKLNARVDLRVVYGSDAADWLSRFPRFWERDSFESLFSYTRSFISVTQDASSGVTKLEVAAFDPNSAKAIAAAMLDAASAMANNLNTRANADMIDSAKRELTEARDDVVKVQGDLTAFRNEALLVDPLAFAGAMLQDIGALSLERARAETKIAEAEKLSPDNPALEALKASAGALDSKVAEERGKLAGGSSALAGKVAKYERLTLLRELAEKRYGAALLSLQTAETEAQRKRVYIEEVVRPNLPDEPTRPERLRDVMSAFIISFIAFSILWILSVGSKDHAQ
jgi:capsular polysaccharide transport system permease protein